MTLLHADAGFEDAARELDRFLASPATNPEPHALFHRVREREPVYWSSVGTWAVLGFPESREALRNTTLSSELLAQSVLGRMSFDTPAAQEAMEIRASAFIWRDPPDHMRLRSIVAKVFNPKVIVGWQPLVADAVGRVTGELAERDGFDLLHDYAYAVSTTIMCEIIGVPPEDQKLFVEWTNESTRVNLTDPNADLSALFRPYVNFVTYLREMISLRRHDLRDDLVSLLISAEEAGDRLSEDEAVGTLISLIKGSHDTTANSIGNGTLALLRHPEEFERLRSDPSLVSSAFEEILRYEPQGIQPRQAAEDVHLGEKVIKAGDLVQVLPIAANRDPREFKEPDRFDITRKDNHHLAFGNGPHYCVGVHLARLEGRAMLGAIAGQMGNLELDGDIVWRTGHIRGLESLPVRRVSTP